MSNDSPKSPFHYFPPPWANTPQPTSDREMLERAEELARAYYPLGVQTGIHSMIEWCGIMAEYAKMLRFAHTEKAISPNKINQHNDISVTAPTYMVEYLCEKLGCLLKPFIRGNKAVWRGAISRWFE
jgi:hypothetical protein